MSYSRGLTRWGMWLLAGFAAIVAASCEAAGGARVRGIVYDFQCFADEGMDRSQDPAIMAECPDATFGRTANVRLHLNAPPTYLIDRQIRLEMTPAKLEEVRGAECLPDISLREVRSVNCRPGGPYVMIFRSYDARNREDFFRWNNYSTAVGSHSYVKTRIFDERSTRRLFYFLPADAPEEVDFRVSMLVDGAGSIFALICAPQSGEPTEYARRADACIDYASRFMTPDARGM